MDEEIVDVVDETNAIIYQVTKQELIKTDYCTEQNNNQSDL